MKGIKVKNLTEKLKNYDPNARCMVWVGEEYYYQLNNHKKFGDYVGFAGLYLDVQVNHTNDPVEFSIFSKEGKQ
tara:strand:+ start:677 stop:898 length:222 start_codon:yes stop_codon:yes gene_type:complete